MRRKPKLFNLCSTNPYILKLSTLFAKYLYQNRQINLPGIGTFTIDPSVTIPDATDKNAADFTQQIKFTQKNITAPDDDFINFIRTETGKIKPLAESDLDSFLSDAKILLNIGKPFYLEGIGSLQKTRAGEYEFTPGLPIVNKPEHAHHEGREADAGRKSVFNNDPQAPNNSRKAIIALSIIVGIALVIWLGYSLYNRNTGTARVADTVEVPPADTARKNIILDSVQRIIDSTSRPMPSNGGVAPGAANSHINPSSPGAGVGTYKFIIEKTYNKARALRRFRQIKDNLTDIRMESSSDSTQFSLYFVLPATAADTTRIKDSLRVWYGRKQVYVEP